MADNIPQEILDKIESEAKDYDRSYFTWLDQHSHKDPKDHFQKGADFGYHLRDEEISKQQSVIQELQKGIDVFNNARKDYEQILSNQEEILRKEFTTEEKFAVLISYLALKQSEIDESNVVVQELYGVLCNTKRQLATWNTQPLWNEQDDEAIEQSEQALQKYKV